MIIRIVLARGYLFKSRSFSSKTDYFQILGIDRSFDIHPDRLKDIYKDNMKILHPDLNTMKSDTEKITIANQASQVTAAYQVLSDPHERAMHLLELLKTPMEEQATGTLVGHDFLMNIMQIREEIENTSSQEKLKEFLDENEKAIANTCSYLSTAFSRINLEDARRYTAQLQYWNRIRETLVEKIEQN